MRQGNYYSYRLSLAARRFREASASEDNGNDDDDVSGSTHDPSEEEELSADEEMGGWTEIMAAYPSDSSLSSMSNVTYTTDAFLLTDPSYAAGQQILSILPPQPDDASRQGPSQPMRPSPRGVIALHDDRTNHKDESKVHEMDLKRTTAKSSLDDLPVVVKPDPTDIPTNNLHRRRLLLWLAVGSLILAAAVAVPFALKSGGESSEDSKGAAALQNTSLTTPTQSPSTAPSLQPSIQPSTIPSAVPSAPPTLFPSASPSAVPSSAPTSLENALLDLIGEASPETAIALDDPSSPQSAAFSWLLDNTSFAQHSPQIILQRFAMAVFYYSTNGDASWTNKNGWLKLNNECTWYNRALSPCNSQGKLVFLELPGNRLSGSLPHELFLLAPSLLEIVLNDNQLTGGVPTTFGQLSKVQVLNLGDNKLTEPIPDELGQMNALESFSLFGNPIMGSIPASLGNLTQLSSLYLAQTSLNGTMPQAICDLNLDDLWADCDAVDCHSDCCTYCCYDSLFCSDTSSNP